MSKFARSDAAALLLLALLTTACATTGASTFREARAEGASLRILEEIDVELTRYFHDRSFRGLDMPARRAETEARVRAAGTDAERMVAIADYVSALGDSHTFFIPPRYLERFDYGFELRFYGDACYVVRVEPGSHGARIGLRAGDRVLEIEGDRVERDRFGDLAYRYWVLEPRDTLHLLVEGERGDLARLHVAADVAVTGVAYDRWSPLAIATHANERREREEELSHAYAVVGDRALVWRMPIFRSRDKGMDEVFERARDLPFMILDLRGNSGGAVKTLEKLSSHLFDREVVIATMWERGEEEVIRAEPARHPFRGKLIVILDSESASASEVFARLVQIEERGLVVGDRSAGAVMISHVYFYGTSGVVYGLSVTVSDLRMADGNRLESVGVTPDRVLLPRPSDLAAGRDPVLAAALSLAGVRISPENAARLAPRRR